MSTIEEKGLVAYLRTVSGVTNLVGSSPARIYPGRLVQNPTFPAVSYQKVSQQHEEILTGSAGFSASQIQLNAWGNTYSEAKSLAEALRTALQGYSGTMGTVTVQGVSLLNEFDDYEAEVDDYRVIMTFEIWHAESVPSF